MCEHCFEKGIYQFETKKDFEFYDSLFFELINKGAIKPFAKIHLDNYFNGETYKCVFCGKVWVINNPDNRGGGFLLTKEELVRFKKKLDLRVKQRRILVAVLIIGMILYFLLTNF